LIIGGNMKNRRRLAVLIVLVLLASSIFTASVLAEPTPPPSDPVALPQAESGWQVSVHSATGKARLVLPPQGGTLRQASLQEAASSPESVARSFLAAYGGLFGLSNGQDELLVKRSRSVEGQADGKARSFVRFQQAHNGVPVLGGELILQMDGQNNVLSASGEVSPEVQISTTSRVAAADASQTALGYTAKLHGVAAEELSAGAPELWIYNPALLDYRRKSENALVWRVEVKGKTRPDIRQLVLVEAGRGGIALSFNQVHAAKYRIVYDNNNVPGAGLPGTGPVRVEGGAASGVTEVNNAYDLAGFTYDYYFSQHGRDSIDNKGMPLVSTVRYCPSPTSCPYENAFWNGSQMVYGDTYASADDVVGHELTHGVTEFESGLFYYMQSGAINESLSDIWGEFIDLAYDTPSDDDTPAARWYMGEDLPIGAIRNMSNPPEFDDPDKVSSLSFVCDPAYDSGGVHINSGIPNKATFLMVDGGTFNGQTITGIGTVKAAKIWYEVQTNLLTSGSDFKDLGDALQLACSNLVGTGGITSGDCTQVNKAVLATELGTLPTSCNLADAPYCTAGQEPLNLYSEGFEDPVSTRWVRTTTTPSGFPGVYWPQSANEYGYDAAYGSGNYNLWAEDYYTTSDFQIAMAQDIALPASPAAYMRFEHAWDFEDYFDGGIVEYSTNGGSSWTNASSLFVENGPNGLISTAYGNPLGGQTGYVYDSGGSTASRVDLSSLAGQSIRFRWRVGSDSSVYDWGWFVDNVEVYTCRSTVSELYLPLLVRAGTAPTGAFHTSFSGSSGNWQTHSGDWTADSKYFETPGLTNLISSVSYPQDYSNITVEARLKHDACSTCAFGLIVRGTPEPLVTGNDWNSGYIFLIDNSGFFAVFKRVSGGGLVTIVPWTDSGGYVNTGGDWNLLKVVANGTNLSFYINTYLIWSGSDTSLSSGRVGVGSYNIAGWNPTQIDWITVTP
jgi:Zn-dependent metalloprotease